MSSSLFYPIKCVLVAHVSDRREELTTFADLRPALEAIVGTKTSDLLSDADHADTEVHFTVHHVLVGPRGREWLETIFEGDRLAAMRALEKPTLRIV